MATIKTSNQPKAKIPVQQVIVEKEVIKLVPVEVIKEVVVEKTVEVIVEKPVETIVEVIKEVEFPVIKTVIEVVEVPVEKIVEVERIVVDIARINEEKAKHAKLEAKLKVVYGVVAFLIFTNILGWAL